VIESVALQRLHPYPGNPRRGNLDAIKRSLRRFGQTKPVVALPDGTIVAGNHLWAAAHALGWTELDVSWWAGSEEEAKAYLVADNRTSELGTVDEADLYALLKEVATFEDDLLAAASYSTDDLAALAHALHSPDLNDLLDAHQMDETTLWPLVRVKVSPEVFAQWQTLVSRYDGEDVAFSAMVKATL